MLSHHSRIFFFSFGCVTWLVGFVSPPPPPPREWNPSPSAVTVASPNHWTTRELSSEIGSETLVRGVTQEGELTEWMVGLEI